MRPQVIAQRLAQYSHTAAVDDAHPRQPGQESAVNEALADESVRQRLEELGFISVGGTAESYAKDLALETEKWRKVRLVRRVVTGALEIARAGKRIGSSLEADPIVHVTNAELREALLSVDLAEVCITSAATLADSEGPADAFRLPDVQGVAVVVNLAEGTKCARSWKISHDVGADPQYPAVTPRDAQALREWETMRKAAE